MLKLFTQVVRVNVPRKVQRISLRTFLSQAYYCNEVWEDRLRNPIIKRVNLDELYHELDQRYNRTKIISAVDVDIFANSVKEDVFIDELMDIIHKLRLSADSSNTLDSTHHALVRCMLNHGRKEELLDILDDRINYGIFLDNYTANLLLDTFWKEKDFLSGARVASQLMLQEDVDHPLASSLSLLHCYSYLLDPKDWPEPQKPEEPEEEVKVRVKYLRNPYFDDHFDLREPNKVVGKTIAMIARKMGDPLEKSFHLLGLALYEKVDKANDVINNLTKNNDKIYKEIIQLLPEDNEIRKSASKLQMDSADISNLLQTKVKQAERAVAEKDIAQQCQLFSKWEEERKSALTAQQERMLTAKRIANIDELQKAMKEKETKLWFFENEEKIELEIQGKSVYHPKRWFGKKKKPRKVDEGYIPPEIFSKQVTKN